MKRIVALCLTMILTLTFCVAVAEEWTCPKCGRTNAGNFCPDCGTKRTIWTCPVCGNENFSAFCENCGTAKPIDTDALIGKWKFSTLGKTIYLTIKNEANYILDIADGGRMEGIYTINGIYLTLTSNDIPFLSGEYSISDGKFTFEHFGTGERTEENSRFQLRMEGASMNDTLGDGDILTVECVEPINLSRFDIVAINYPERGSTIFVKRLVAFAGEEVEFRDGYLYINGERFEEEEYIMDEYRAGRLNTFGPYTVPENSYFVLGDHRNNSNDSRFVQAIPAEMMIGVVTAINGNAYENER